ncbi:HPr family phosphocarrier protein [Clostridium thermopalmarium]|uniref:Phosphocarrier protein HPr n=1 Tax=Clostridium thermopalmarium DSM 5974 TaxID=1121340 RepID=A0A2T0APR0_9CLOT|nr:HPr family phosphocarrier protein [Clostridium thermopalmarium]PRR71009.1 HPr-like protein Crh [Clostridium thermopalmarium DSM 5974]PVZ23651.1 phosphocarrier protein [Clostridium thermopalmarium DSM 5974]
MVTKSVTITNKSGIHARPASLFIKIATNFKSNITIENGNNKGNAKSLISVLSLAIACGSEVTITADGPDENEAIDALVKLIESKFGEE